MLNLNHRFAYVMVLIALLALFQLLNMNSLAADPAMSAGLDFNTLKQKMMNHLKTELACMEMASDEPALRACRPLPSGRPSPRNPDVGGNDSASGNPNHISDF